MFVPQRIAFLLAVISGFVTAVHPQDPNPIDVAGTESILITSVMPVDEGGGLQRRDAALVIREPDQVSKLVSLFNGNVQHKVHACGYHWRMTFFRRGREATEIYFNQQCEKFDRNTAEICRFVQKRFDEVLRRPNAFLSNIEVRSSQPPEEAKQELESSLLRRVLFLSNTEDRLPFIELEASSTSKIPDDRTKWNTAIAETIRNADQPLINNIARIRERYHVVKISEIRTGMSMFGGGEIFEQRIVKIYFEVGTKLNDVHKGLELSKVATRSEPAGYSIQLVSDHRLSQSEMNDLISAFPFIVSVGPYK